jgi:hypothetical protein
VHPARSACRLGGGDDVEPAPDARQSQHVARPALAGHGDEARAAEPHLGVGPQQPGNGRGVGGGHAIEVGDHGRHQVGRQGHLQSGVQHLARGHVELAPQLDHRGHAHPVLGAPEQRSDRSWDLLTVDAHR